MIFLHDFTSMDCIKIPNIDRFFQINDFKILKKGHWSDDPSREKRLHITNFLWEKRRDIQKLYWELCKDHHGKKGSSYVDNPGKSFSLNKPVSNGIFVTAKLDQKGNAMIGIGKVEYKLKNFPGFASYLCGGWLEEYAYKLLEPLVKAGKVNYLRIGLEVNWESSHEVNSRAQEFDIAFTDGKSLYIVECKAGNVKSDHVYKLSDCVRTYGGVLAKGFWHQHWVTLTK